MATLSATGVNNNLLTDIGGVAPSAGDSVFVNKGNVDYTNGAGNTFANDLARLQMGPGWKGNVPGSAPIILVADRTSTGLVECSWGGQELYLQSTSGTGIIHKILVNPVAGGKVYLGPCDNELLFVTNGIVQAAATADVENCYAGGFGRALLLASGPQLTLVKAQQNSAIDLYRDVVTAEILDAATIRILDDSCTPTTINQDGGSMVGGHGDVGTYNLYSGLIDWTALTKPITITNWNVFGPATIRLARGGPGMPTRTNSTVHVEPTVEWV